MQMFHLFFISLHPELVHPRVMKRESGENPGQNPAGRHLPVAFPAAVSRPLRRKYGVTELFGKTFAARRQVRRPAGSETSVCLLQGLSDNEINET